MLFSGITFLYYFLPVALLVYTISPKPLKNTTLLIFSLIFYGWGEPVYVFLMAATIILGYIFGILIEKFRGKPISKVFCLVSVAISLSFLLYFKYADFFITNFNAVTGLGLPLLKIALPIGISFYTFQIISYTIDVYRGDKAQYNPINLAAYVTMFPQLIAGPIVRYCDIARQLESEQIYTPTMYEFMETGVRLTGFNEEMPYRWTPDTVSSILEREDYIGNTVNCRYTRLSYKDKRRVERPESEHMRVEHSHEAIIDDETWRLVQKLRANKRRPKKMDGLDKYSGLLFCEDCGSKMYFVRGRTIKPEAFCFVCSRYHKHNTVDKCTPHTIRVGVLDEIVLAAKHLHLFAHHPC